MLAIATLIQVVATATALALTAITPIVSSDLGVGTHWIGYQISLIYFAGIFASAFAGTLVLRHGPVMIEQCALVGFALGLLGLAGGTLATIILGSIAIGFGYGLNNPASSHILNAVTPPGKRNLVYSVKQAGVPIGAIIASVVFPLAAERLGWRVAMLAAAAVPLSLALALAWRGHAVRFTRVRDAAFGAGLIEEQRLVWRDKSLRALAGVGFLYAAVQLSLSAFVVTMLVREGHWSLLSAGRAAAAMQIGGTLGRVLWGLVADRWRAGFPVLAAIGGLGGVLCVLCGLMLDFHWSAQMVILFAIGLCASGWNGVHLAEAARLAPIGKVGPVTGGVLVYIFMGVMVGPACFAVIFGVIGDYATTFMAFSTLSLLGGLIAVRYRGSRGSAL